MDLIPYAFGGGAGLVVIGRTRDRVGTGPVINLHNRGH